MDAGTPAPERAPQVAQVEVRSRDRVAVRTRESNVTLSAWRVELAAPRGAIVMLEIGDRSVFRGEGTLLGWTQERLAETWRAALPPEDPPPDMPQLG